MNARPRVPIVRVLSVLALVGPFLLAACGGEPGLPADAEDGTMEPEALGTTAPEEAAAPSPAPDATPQAPPATTPAPPTAAAPPPPATTPGSEPTPSPVLAPGGEDPDPVPETAPVSIPQGTRIPAVMEIGLSTRMNEAGDTFHARIVEEILAPDGMVLVPEGARLEGRVAEAVVSSGPEDEALLLLTFEALLIRGERFPVHASVAEAELESSAQASGARSAATIATGAAAGAVVGRVLGRDTRSTAVGAAAGAAAGAGVALTTRDGHATIREGARVVVRLESPAVLTSGR